MDEGMEVRTIERAFFETKDAESRKRFECGGGVKPKLGER